MQCRWRPRRQTLHKHTTHPRRHHTALAASPVRSATPKRWPGQISIQLTWFNRDHSHNRGRVEPDLLLSYSPPRPTRLLRVRPSPAGSPRLTTPPRGQPFDHHPSAPSATLLLPRPASEQRPSTFQTRPRPRPPLPSPPAPRQTGQIPRVTLGATTHHATTSPQSARVPPHPSRPGFSPPSFSPQPLAKACRCCVPAPWRHGTALGAKPAEAHGGFAEPSGAAAERRVGGGRRFLVPSVSTAGGWFHS